MLELRDAVVVRDRVGGRIGVWMWDWCGWCCCCWRLEAGVEVGMVKVSLRLIVRGNVRVWVRFTAMFKRC